MDPIIPKTPKVRKPVNSGVRPIVRPMARSKIITHINERRPWVWSVLAGLAVLLLGLGFFYGPALYARYGPRPTIVYKDDGSNESLKSANQLVVPSLGIEAPIVYVDQTGEAAFQEALIDGVVHYPGTALPGKEGNVYIFGHSSDLPLSKGKFKTIFAKLPDIETGAEIKITDQRGREFTYEVTGTQVIEPDDLSVLTQDPTKHQLTLQTSYPVGTARKRFIVTSELKD